MGMVTMGKASQGALKVNEDGSTTAPKTGRGLFTSEVDWIALSFVQRPEDIAEARKLIAGRAAVMAKLEKPMALNSLEEIVSLCDAIMVARGDLGVEMPTEEVPIQQKKIISACRAAGKPVIIATQMLDSMVLSLIHI